MFLLPGVFLQFFGEKVIVYDGVQILTVSVELLEYSSPLDIPAGDVVGVVVVPVLVRTLPIPFPPLLDRLPLVRIHSYFLRNRVGLPPLSH